MVVRSQAHLPIESSQTDGWLSAALGRKEVHTQAESIVSEVKHHPISSRVRKISFLDDLSGGIIITEQALKVVIDGTVWGITSASNLIDAHMFPSRRHFVILTPDNMEVVELKRHGNRELEVLQHGGPREWPGVSAIALTPLGRELIFAFTSHPQGMGSNAVHQVNSFVFKDPSSALHRWDCESYQYSSLITSLCCTNIPRRLLTVGHASGKIEVREVARAGVLGRELASGRFEERGAITSMAFHKDRLFAGNCHGEVREFRLISRRHGIDSLDCISVPFKSSGADSIRAMHYVPQDRRLVVWGGHR